MITENNTSIASASLLGMLRKHVRDHPAHGIRLMNSDTPSFLTYPDLWKASLGYARGLHQAGIRSGDVVAIPMQPTAEVVIAIVAMFHLGCRLVPLLYRRESRTDSPGYKAFVSALTISNAHFILVEEDDLEYYQTLVQGTARPILPIAFPRTEGEEATEIEEWPESGAFSLVQFSSGSLAAPRGIVLSRENIYANVSSIAERIAARPEDVCYSWLPLYHDMGLIGALFTSFYAGATLCLDAPLAFISNPLSWLTKMSAFGATITVAPQFAYNLCNKLGVLTPQQLADVNLSALRLAMNGAENIHYASCALFESRFAANGLRRHVIQPCYGLSENCVAVTMRVPGTPLQPVHLSRQGLAMGRADILPEPSVETITALGNGSAVRGTEISIMTGDDIAAGEGQTGEVWIRGRSTTRSILRSAAEQDEVFYPSDAWVPTGDIGFWHEGELYIIGRSKEIFKKGGRTYIPNDIETALQVIPEVGPNQVVAISTYSHERAQEELVIIVELFNNRGDLSGIEENIRRVLLSHFQLSALEILFVRIGGLAKTSSGKLKRLQIRSMYERKELQYLTQKISAENDKIL
jgi:acyl-CoA synthetase (AMP-forming)/AMP-acid ligase II